MEYAKHRKLGFIVTIDEHSKFGTFFGEVVYVGDAWQHVGYFRQSHWPYADFVECDAPMPTDNEDDYHVLYDALATIHGLETTRDAMCKLLGVPTDRPGKIHNKLYFRIKELLELETAVAKVYDKQRK
jgi:hypothetical protein